VGTQRRNQEIEEIMPNAKPTAATVHTELVRHETECAERWRTNFKQLDKLEASITKMMWWMIGGLTTIGASLLTLVLRSLFTQ
jgi:phosphate uptake regulator